MSAVLSTLLKQLSTLTHWRLATFFAESPLPETKPPLPEITLDDSALGTFLRHHKLSFEEIIILSIALAPHVEPYFFDALVREYIPQGGDIPQIGGTRGKQFRGFLPTGETALFILAGDDMQKRFGLMQLFDAEHVFYQKQVLRLEEPPEGEPRMSGKLVMSPEYVELFSRGIISLPRFSTSFPAERVETMLKWKDLILPEGTMQQVNELLTWIEHGQTLLRDWGMIRHVKPGYRALFHGPPGTGKTLTAALIGQQTHREVFKIDLSMVVSKFIGETEKNLAQLFDRAENKDWILFFDEADALFGKRTGVRDAHDRYANQEVSYLLQRVENFDGLVILASNIKSNIDDAFTRRFQSMIHFPMPGPSERLRLWQNALPKALKLAPEVNLVQIAEKYELSGAAIVNIIQFCGLMALQRKESKLYLEDLQKAITREFEKEGKIL